MPSNVKQHFVPKFYLKYFSVDNNNKSINLFNKDKEIFITNAALASQAFKNYYYGKDGVLEKSFADVEGKAATLIKYIINSHFLPRQLSELHRFLLFFTLLTDLRNLNYNKILSGSLNSMHNSMFSQEDIVDPKFDLRSNNTVYLSLAALPVLIDLCADLDFKLIINESNLPFITSDYPIIKYNQFLEMQVPGSMNTGYSSLGLQIILPLSPKVILIYYDSDIYKVGSSKKRIVHIDKLSEIEMLNVLQILNCGNNLYFNNEVQKSKMFDLYYRSKQYPKPHQNITSKIPESSNSAYHITTTTQLETKMQMDWIKLTDYAKGIIINKSKLVHLRPWAEKVRNERM